LTPAPGFGSIRRTVSSAVSTARERIEVREVRTQRERARFIRFPETIYRGDPNWVPPLLVERRDFLDPRKNPFFEHAEVGLFMAHGPGGAESGRIAAIVNHNHVRTHGEQAGFFGMFECVDDPEAARLLFEAAAGFLRARGMEVMRGPENLCVNDDIGLLIEGFDTPPAIMMPYNPPYYRALVEGCGFAPSMKLLAYRAQIRDGRLPERFERGVALVRRRYDHRVRPIDMKRFDEEVRRIHRVYSSAWEENWGAVPMTDREFAHLASSLKLVVDPSLCLVAEVGGEVVGFSLALPDLNQALIHLRGRLLPFGFLKLLWYRRKIDALRIITMGVVKEHRGKGIDLLFYHESARCAFAKGYRHVEMSWVLENNLPMNLVLRSGGAEVAKTYQLYDRAI
jgi:GNAT superfamily N-acetyltransferase